MYGKWSYLLPIAKAYFGQKLFSFRPQGHGRNHPGTQAFPKALYPDLREAELFTDLPFRVTIRV